MIAVTCIDHNIGSKVIEYLKKQGKDANFYPLGDMSYVDHDMYIIIRHPYKNVVAKRAQTKQLKKYNCNKKAMIVDEDMIYNWIRYMLGI